MSDESDLFGGDVPDGAAGPSRSPDAQGARRANSKPPRVAARVQGSGLSLLDLHASAVYEKLIEKATRGDMSAQWLFYELKRRDRSITLDIPKIETAKDALAANARVISAVTGGELTPAEGANIGSMIALQIKLLEALDHEKRIQALEKEHNHESPDQQTS
jgi:hypothetical protein